MGCIDPNDVVAFFAPGRSADLVARVDEHASRCEVCRRLLAEYASLAEGTAMTAVAPASLAPAASKDVSGPAGVAQLLGAQKRIGTVLKGKWTVERLLGKGGMAHVYEARHRNGRRVAVKFMRPELATEVELVQRFLREGYVANTVDHPGALAILDDDVAEDGAPFLVMELLVGETLRERLARGPLPLAEALDAIDQVLDVLASAHDKGVVHRDLKPDNLFVIEGGAIKILDFGIARLREQTPRNAVETRSGTTMGTVGFMAPEQARGLTAQVDARSDVWAVGATLYTLLTGRPLHEASTPNEALLLAMTEPVPPMAKLVPGLPPAVSALLDRALAFAPDARWPDARAMRVALQAARASLPPVPHHGTVRLAASAVADVAPAQATSSMIDRAFARSGVSPEPKAMPRAWVAIAGGALAGLLAAVTWMAWPASSGPRTRSSTAPAVSSAVASPGSLSASAAASSPAPAATVVVAEAVTASALAAPSASAAAPPRRPPPARPAMSAPPRPPAASSSAPLDPLGPRL